MINMELKKTPFYQKHLENKAKIVNFGGWALPVEYQGSLAEARITRGGCGLFDASHMGEIVVKGEGALDFLQSLTPNDISAVSFGHQQYNLFLNETGGVIDDLMVYVRKEDFYCVVNAVNKDKVLNWLVRRKPEGVDVIDESSFTGLLCLQGPQSEKVIDSVFGERISSLSYMRFKETDFLNQKILISRSGYTGEDGFELYCQSEVSSKLWDALTANNCDVLVTPCGLGARDILRIEAGYPLYGHELDEHISPLEASLDWVIKFNKDFIAKDILFDIKMKTANQKRVGFVMIDKSVPRQGYLIYCHGKVVGKVSSGTFSPNLSKFIGMAFIDREFSLVSGVVDIEIRGKFYKAEVTKYPFLSLGRKKTIKSGK